MAKPLHVEPWSWTLEQAAPGLVLSVVCGTVGLYERAIVLSRDEVKIWVDGGPAALEPLVEKIRNDVTGSDFADRYRPDLLEP
ncbi:MAG: hypothetical protein WCH82_08545 [Mycobacteriaceae bacterium]